ncbi:hypothetical protein GALL_400970 [mine drainage metagenome]|uniref:Uncharacterized protein n=1 Tax=mine drainage metagenome TaxID=410659 RepID=A0A1J5Q3E3_9ZZZZ
MAVLELLVHIGLNHVHRHMSRAFDHGLHIMLPGNLRELTQRSEFGKLRFIIGIGTGSWTQTVAQ